MVSKVKHQHYIPQMYLKRFANEKGQLYAYDLANQKGYYNIPRSFAHEKFLYDIDENILRSLLAQYEALIEPDLADSLSKEQLAEHMLANIEEKASKILTALDLGKLSIEDEQVHVILISFLNALAWRTPDYRNSMEKIHHQTVPVLQQFNIPPKNQWAKYCEMSSEAYAKNAQVEALFSLSNLLKTTYMLEENYNWYIGIVNASSNLIISDNPLQMLRQGFNDICFPISPRKAIIFRVKDQHGPLISQDMPVDGVVSLSWKSVSTYNALQKAQASRFIFGDKKSVDEANIVARLAEVMQNHS